MAMDLPAYQPTSDTDAREHIRMILGDDADGLFSLTWEEVAAKAARTVDQWAATAPAPAQDTSQAVA